jgi:hypothetical protein
MINQTNSIKDILTIINQNNILRMQLPVHGTEIEVKRYSVDSLNIINEIVDMGTSSEIIYEYTKYLIDFVKDRTTLDLSYLDFCYTIFYVRKEENNIYNDINLNEINKEIKSNVDSIKVPEKLSFQDNSVNYNIEFNIPKMSDLSETIKLCKAETKDLIFYNIFKFIKSVEISTQDQKVIASSKEDLYQLYDVISYKSLEVINKHINKLAEEIYNTYHVNIEADTAFLYSI